MSEAEQSGTGREEIWLEKYRPQTFDDIVGQDTIVDRLRSYVERDDLPHMLFAGPAGIGKCVTGETPVLTDDGLYRMEDVVGETDGFETNDTGTSVLSFTDDGEFEYVEPSHTFGKRAESLLSVSTRDGSEMTVTPEHKLFVLTHDGLEWRKATDIEPGDRVVRPLKTPIKETDERLNWVEQMDGERTFVHVTEGFTTEHDIPFEENLVGVKKQVVKYLRKGKSVDEIATLVDTPRKTVTAVEREFRDDDLEVNSTVCSLSYLRGLEVPRDELREHVERIQYVAPSNNKRSAPITPPWELTPELARLVGLAISEARIENGRINFYNTDDNLRTAFQAGLTGQFGVDPRCGEQQGVPYVAIGNRTVTHYLESCFDAFDSEMGGEGIGSTLLHADEQTRKAFLRAVFDAEAHLRTEGILELTQKNEDRITLLAYLLSSVGIPCRRKEKRKRATNGSEQKRTYHTLYISGTPHLRAFEKRIGFSIAEKSDRLSQVTERPSNPNDDTILTQQSVDELCQRLNLAKTASISDTLNPDTPGRRRYLDGVSELIDDATERLERVQQARERLTQLEPAISEVVSVPSRWVGQRKALEPLTTRKQVQSETGVGTDRLLEYARGDRTPYAGHVQQLLSEVTDRTGQAPVETLQCELREIIESLDISYNRLAEETELRGTDISNLLKQGDHEVRSLSRFATVADRLDTVLSRMASTATIEHLHVLDRLVASDIYVDEVTEVEPVDEPRRVYDLTVPGPRNYVAGTVPTVMHNTTSAVAIARELYGEDWEEHFLELNASDERGIDVVRDRIKSFARTSFGGVDYRIIFLDEADALCVPPGTEVVTGYPSSPEVKKIENVVEDGEPIPSVDFDTNEIQSDKGRLVDSGVADFFEVQLEDGREITASLTHPFFVVDEDGTLVEKELRELSPGDEIADFKDDIGVSKCDTCGDWTTGRFCSVPCKNDGHSNEMQGEFESALVSDGGVKAVETVEIQRIEHSHRGKAYNISMEGTPNFMLANGILTHNTSDAQSALRRTMEQFSNNVRFILSCNYSSQIIDPIQSRCAVFRFSPLGDDAVESQVRKIAETEGITLTDDGVGALVYAADGDMRRAINGLQAASVTGGTVDEEAVYEITSTARPEEINEMVTLALGGDFTAARSRLDQLITEEGIAGGDIIDQLHRSVWEFELDDEAAVQLLDRIGEADYRITAGANERIQLEALLASLALDE